MEIWSSETPNYFQQTTRRFIPQDITPQEIIPWFVYLVLKKSFPPLKIPPERTNFSSYLSENLLVYDGVKSGKSVSMFRKKVLFQSSGPKSNPSSQQQYCSLCLLLGLFFERKAVNSSKT
jgi:hypothetical protein